MANAARARHYRARQTNVTHQGSPPPPPDDVVSVDTTVAASKPPAAFHSVYWRLHHLCAVRLNRQQLAAKARGQGFMSFVLAEMKLRRVLIGVLTTSNASDTEIAIRQNVLDAIGAKAAVFDAFAGSGDMCSAVWKKGRHLCRLRSQAADR